MVARMTTELITKKEACAILRVSPATVERYVRAGMLAKVKLGDRPQSAVRFRKSDVERLIGASLKAPGTRTKEVKAAPPAPDPGGVPYRPKSW